MATKNFAQDREVIRRGKALEYYPEGSAAQIEKRVRQIAARAHARLDWGYAAGRATIFHLGDENSRQRVVRVIKRLEKEWQQEREEWLRLTPRERLLQK